MTTLESILDIDGFSISSIDVSGIQKLSDMLPKNGVVDVNIAERSLVITLEGQNLCQEKVVLVDRWIGYLEGERNKAWSEAALVKSKESGYKTGKDKEWFAQSDDKYIETMNSITLAKASKKWLENKASYFSGWHYAMKTFLKRDYSLENLANFSNPGYTNNMEGGQPNSYSHREETQSDDMCGEHDWG
jgi:hypothetical protein